MGVEEVIMYRVLCDRCGLPDDTGSYYAWKECDQAIDVAVDEAAWLRVIDGTTEYLYCPDCTTWDEEKDELVPLPPATHPTTEAGEA